MTEPTAAAMRAANAIAKEIYGSQGGNYIRDAAIIDRETGLPQLLAACMAAKAHTDELECAWSVGSISEHDGRGGARSNRNREVTRQIEAAIAAEEGT